MIGTEKQLLAFMNGKFVTIDSGIKTTTREDNKDALSSAIDLAGGIKTKFNEHIASGGTGLATAIDLANALKMTLNTHFEAAGTALTAVYAWANALSSVYTAHLADLNEHKIADVTNVLSTPDATTPATLYNRIKELLDMYALHNADAEDETPALVYHYAENTTPHGLASVVKPTSLALSITRLTDIKLKLNAHDNDGASHGTPSSHQNSTVAVVIGSEVHPHSAQAIITTANADSLASLYTLAKSLADAYAAHNADAILSADWIYHKAAGTTHALIGTTTPTSLAAAITMLNDVKTKYNLHAVQTVEHGIAGTIEATADATVGSGEHTAQADTAHTITAPSTITTLAQLKTLVTELITDYALHEADAALGVNWAYHKAQETGTHALASEVAPTTLQECVTRLNDIKAKFNAHDADTNSHTTGSTKQVSTANAAYGATNRVSLTGALSEDKGIFAILNDGTGNVTGVGMTIGNGYADIEFSADPQNDTIYSYQVLREVK